MSAKNVALTRLSPTTSATVLCPRQRRLLMALLGREVTREQADRIARASNGPAVVSALRSKGLHIRCERREKLDADGKIVRPGTYILEKESIPLAAMLLNGREREFVQARQIL